MFDSNLPEQNHNLDASFKQLFAHHGFTLESTNIEIIPSPRTNSGFSKQIEINNLTASDYDNNVLNSHLSLESQSDRALNSGGDRTTSADKSSVDPLTGEFLSNDIVETAFQSAQGYLKAFATAPDFNAKMNQAFGNTWNAEVASNLFPKFTWGNFSNLPATPVDNAGNSLPLARNIGNLSSTQTFSDFIGTADTNDFYRFTLTNNSNFSLTLNGLSGDADVELLDINGNLIQNSTNGGTTADTINRTLNAGTYFARVYPMSGVNTNYSLSLTANPVAVAPANWTFMVYMAGDNLENFAVDDFLEMANVGSRNNVNVVVQLDRTAGYDNRFGDWTDTRRGIINTGSTPGLNWGTSIGEANMGDPNTLSNFVNWATTNYQANNYSLILWGHGDGRGTAYDDLNRDTITASELSGVLSGFSNRINLVGADSCLMGMTEFAHQIRNQTSVFVGSQELVPGPGFNYTTILSALTANSTMNATQLGTTIVNRYGQHYASRTVWNDNDIDETLSAINLGGMKNLSNALSQFATTFMKSSTLSDRSLLETHRANSGTFGDVSGYRDLGTLLSRVANDIGITASIRTAAQTALNAYNSAILGNYSSINGRGTGLSINFQQRRTASTANYNNWSPSFAADTTWDEFLSWWRTA